MLIHTTLFRIIPPLPTGTVRVHDFSKEFCHKRRINRPSPLMDKIKREIVEYLKEHGCTRGSVFADAKGYSRGTVEACMRDLKDAMIVSKKTRQSGWDLI